MEKIFGTEVYPFESEMGISLRLRDRAVMTAEQLKMLLKSSPELSSATTKRFQQLPDLPDFRNATLFKYDKCFRFCADCLAEGYHSFWHQLLALKLCPIHKTPLTFECNCCGTYIGHYDRFGSAMKHAFHCNKCGMEIFGATKKLREQPSNTEIFALALTFFPEIENWIKNTTLSENSIRLLVNSELFRGPVFEYGRASIPELTNLVCFNKYCDISQEILAFDLRPIIYLRCRESSNSSLFDLYSSYGQTHWHPKNYSKCLTMIIKRIEDAFEITHLKDPDKIFLSWDSPTSPPIPNQASINALSIIVIIFDSFISRSSLYENSLYRVGNALKLCSPHRSFFAFRVVDLFCRLMTFFSENKREKPTTLDGLYKFVSTAVTGCPDRRFVPSCILGLPELREFSRLTEKGIFRRWKTNYLEHATPDKSS